jgi:transcriptional pleiotropic regulator of transition state genes
LAKKYDSSLLPKSEASLRGFMIAVLQESLPNLSTLREKEWAMKEVERLKNPNKLDGARRNIKNTGIVRRVDSLGRIVIPMELRRLIGIGAESPLDISLDDQNNWILIEPYQSDCHFCGGKDDINLFKGKRVCEKCINELSDV